MICPRDLCDIVNDNPDFQWYVYDMGLMPEQITTKEMACALRGAWFGWKAHEDMVKNKELLK